MLVACLTLSASPLSLRSGDAELLIDPTIGRITSIRTPGKPNRLWTNTRRKFVEGEWANYGGDKLWPAPQSDWSWPPDPDLDGSPHVATRIGDGITLTTPKSRQTGIQLDRKIRALGSRRFEITNRITNHSGVRRRLSVWQIAQIVVPNYVELSGTQVFRPYANAPMPEESSTYIGGRVRFAWHPTKSYKVGASSGAKWRAVYSDGSLSMSAQLAATAAYPDQGRPFQLFSSAGAAKYMELEVAGPLRWLEPGSSTSTVVILSVDKPE